MIKLAEKMSQKVYMSMTDHLQILFKLHCKKETIESKSISIHTHNMARTILNRCVATRKPLVSKANWKKKHKDWTGE